MGKERVAILGGKGMLGSDVARECALCGMDAKQFDLPEFDITNESHVREAIEWAGAVVNCAAYTNVDKAESEAELAYRVNAGAVGMLGRIAKAAEKWVLHVSTDFVFDGLKDGAYSEEDEARPLNVYGASKLAGEKMLAESGCANAIMRVEWTYGEHGNNFVKKLVKLAEGRDELKVVSDQVGGPSWTREVAKAICEFAAKRPEGLYHFANGGYVSRYEMAKFVFEKLGIGVRVKACGSDEFVSAAKRPLNSMFDCSKISGVLDGPIRGWGESLEEFLREL